MKIKIGFEAERAYIRTATEKKDTHELMGQYYFFRRFKLMLYRKVAKISFEKVQLYTIMFHFKNVL
jgi:hypothetical protein